MKLKLFIKQQKCLSLKKRKTTSPANKRTQFPLVLSWAYTVYNVQDLSLISVVVSFDLEKHNSYEDQMYVALRWVTSIDNLFLMENILMFSKLMQMPFMNISDCML